MTITLIRSQNIKSHVKGKFEGWELYKGQDDHDFRSECKKWYEIVKKDFQENGGKLKKALLCKHYDITTEQDKKNFEKFYNGQVIHTDPETKNTTILRVSDLPNPVEDEFDLSWCNAEKHLSIHTGRKKGKILRNSDKIEIWLTPWFMIQNEFQNPKNCFERVSLDMEQRTWSTAVFWTRGNSDRLKEYDYFSDTQLLDLNKDNLYSMYNDGYRHDHGLVHKVTEHSQEVSSFVFKVE